MVRPLPPRISSVFTHHENLLHPNRLPDLPPPCGAHTAVPNAGARERELPARRGSTELCRARRGGLHVVPTKRERNHLVPGSAREREFPNRCDLHRCFVERRQCCIQLGGVTNSARRKTRPRDDDNGTRALCSGCCGARRAANAARSSRASSRSNTGDRADAAGQRASGPDNSPTRRTSGILGCFRGPALLPADVSRSNGNLLT